MMEHPLKTAALVRSERVADGPAISSLIVKAYASVGYSDHREHLMVERLRDSPSYVPELALVAEVDGDLVGHLLLTRISVEGATASAQGLSLAPLSVAPEHQGQGVGSMLIAEAHARAERSGFGFILLVGLPDYYPRFGYEPLHNHPITLPFAASEANCMIRKLRPSGLTDVEGVVHFEPVWLDH